MLSGRITIETPRALLEEFKLYCKEQHISYDQRITELIEAELKNKKGSLGPYYHPNLKASSDSIRPKAVKEDQSLDNFLDDIEDTLNDNVKQDNNTLSSFQRCS